LGLARPQHLTRTQQETVRLQKAPLRYPLTSAPSRPEGEEFQIVLKLAETGATLNSYAVEEALMTKLEKEMNSLAKKENFEKALELQIGVNELRMFVSPRKAIISRTTMTRALAQKAYHLAFSGQDWTSCRLWKEIIAASDHLLSDHEKRVQEMKTPATEKDATIGGVEAERTATIGGVMDAPETEAEEEATVAEGVAEVFLDDTVNNIADDLEIDPLQQKQHSQARSRKTRHYQPKLENTNRVIGQSKRDPVVITKMMFDVILNLSWTGKKYNNGTHHQGPNKLNHGLELVDGKIHCFVCNDGKAKSYSGLPAHLGSHVHQAKLPSYRATVAPKQAQIIDIAKAQKDKQLYGQSWDVETRTYR
jgi:hypothetical protein